MNKHFKLYLASIALCVFGLSPLHAQKGIVYATSKGTNEKLTKTATIGFEPHAQPLETDVCIFVDPNHRFQSIIGFGGALTDAAAETFARLP